MVAALRTPPGTAVLLATGRRTAPVACRAALLLLAVAHLGAQYPDRMGGFAPYLWLHIRLWEQAARLNETLPTLSVESSRGAGAALPGGRGGALSQAQAPPAERLQSDH